MADQSPRTEGTSDGTGAGSARRSRTGGLWIGLILSAIVLVFLLIFILQNRDPARITFLGWTGALPTGVALLFAAIAGMLLVAIPGSIRILQLRRAAVREGPSKHGHIPVLTRFIGRSGRTARTRRA